MEAEGMDLVALLEGGPLPQLPDDLDDLFADELMLFLSAPDASQPVGHDHLQQPSLATSVPVAVDAPAATAPSISSSSSRSEGVASPSPAPPSIVPDTATAFAPSFIQPATAIPRLVTTTAAQQMWTAMLQAACSAPPAVTCVDEAKVRNMQPAGTSRQGSHDCSGDSSDTDQDDVEMEDSKGKASAGNKRKAPEVDWRQITDPAERRRQRRLAKNRVTAARSRERKKAAWGELEEKLKGMENENLQLRAMLEQFARENNSLKSQLLNITRAGAAAGGGMSGVSQARASKTMDPAVILPVFIVTLLVVCSLLPGDKACALLGSVLPLALMASMLGTADSASAHPTFDSLFQLLHMLGTLLSTSKKALQRSFKRLLFERHRYLGRKGMQKLALSRLNLLLNDPGIRNPANGDAGGGGAAAEPVAAVSAASGHCCRPDVLFTSAVVKLEPVH